MHRLKTRDITVIPLFTALIAVCSFITIPIPTVPFTLQLFGIFAALLCLGGERGTISVILYLVLGSVGLPIFSGFRSGIGCLVGVTGGYLT